MGDTMKLSVFTAAYKDKDSAKADYKAVKDLYYKDGVMDTFDAAIVQRDSNGKVKIVKKHEQPTRQMGWAGASIGMAVSLVTALFPAVALTGGLVAGGSGIGAAYGALIGHLTAGMSRSDLKKLGEVLDKGDYGLVVIAVTDVSARVEEALSSAAKVAKKDFKTDKKQLDKQIRKALKS